ncbi:MAG: hypothetical protein ABWY25_06065 [Paenisporosarcina sp.]
MAKDRLTSDQKIRIVALEQAVTALMDETNESRVTTFSITRMASIFEAYIKGEN